VGLKKFQDPRGKDTIVGRVWANTDKVEEKETEAGVAEQTKRSFALTGEKLGVSH